MSVFVNVRIKVNPDALLKASDQLPPIAERAKAAGCLHHRFLASEEGDTVVVVDEWDSKEAFQKFFEEGEDVRAMMGSAGVTEPPKVTFWRPLDTPDQF
jgi:quinol monooxygenase YgiN